jgi:hypothetical protein
MPTTVTLLIYSGRRDPTWILAAGDAATLAERLVGFESRPELGSLGYRGFRVQSTDPGMPAGTIVRGAPELERFLLGTGASAIPPEVRDAVERAIESS